MVLFLVALLVSFLNLEHVTAVPTQIKDNPITQDSQPTLDSTGYMEMLGYLTEDEALRVCEMNSQFYPQCMTSLLSNPYWHSKDSILKNIETLIKCADKRALFSPNQQLWILEAILSSPINEQTAKWLEIVKDNFQLKTEMYNVCIRIIQNRESDETMKRIAAEFMIFMKNENEPCVSLPDKVNIVPFNLETIINQYSRIDEGASLELIHALMTIQLDTVQELLQLPGIDVNKADQNGYTALIWASSRGHLQIVKELLKQPGIDVNKADKNEFTALILASRDGRLEIVELLLEQPGIDVNKADKHGNNALIVALSNGHLEIIQSLLKKPGINVNQSGMKGKTALMWAANLQIVKELLKKPGIDVNKTDDNEYTALIYASAKGRLEIVQELLKHSKINVNQAGKDGKTALMWATTKGHSEIVTLLEEKMNRGNKRFNH
jgi:ankyrin repeat protein